jgi:hypothetical protein
MSDEKRNGRESEKGTTERPKRASVVRLTLVRHAIAIVIAICVGCIAVHPHALHVDSIGQAYAGIPYLPLDDEDIYLARIHEIVDGHWLVGSPFFFEYKNALPAYPPVGEFLYALPSLLFHVPLAWVVIGSKFLLPALFFLLIYVLVLRLTDPGGSLEARLNAAAAGLVCTIGYQVLDADSLSMLARGESVSTQILLWTRPVNPVTGGLLLFCMLLFLWSLVHKRRRRAIVFIGLLTGLSASYFFSWGIALSVLVFLAMFYAFRGNAGLRNDVLSSLLIAGVVSAVVLLPTVWTAFFGGAGSGRIGAIHTHVPMLNKTVLASLAVFVVLTACACRRRGSPRCPFGRDWWIFSAALLLGCLWVFSQQTLTGFTVWPAHFVQYAKPLCFVVLAVTGFRVVAPKMPFAWSFGTIACILLLLGMGYVDASKTLKDEDAFRSLQGDAQLYRWLNENAPKDCVVYVKEKSDHLVFSIPAYTPCNVYHTSWQFSGVPAERVKHNFFAILRADGVTTQTFGTYIRTHPDLVRGYFFTDWNDVLTPEVDAEWIEGRIRELEPEYRAFLERDFASELRKYRMDYIFVEGASAETQSIGLPFSRLIGTMGSGALFEPPEF